LLGWPEHQQCRCGACRFAALVAVPLPEFTLLLPMCCVYLYWTGCGFVVCQTMEPVLPFAMAFAAGAMVFVVVDDLVPEAQVHGNGRAASIGCMAGFIVMMSLDVALG
jgi:zinc transporter ZupT